MVTTDIKSLEEEGETYGVHGANDNGHEPMYLSKAIDEFARRILNGKANVTIITDCKFFTNVYMSPNGSVKDAPSSTKVKKAIERLFSEGIATTDNQWYAIKRVLCDSKYAPQKYEDFTNYVDSLHLDNVPKYNHENVKKVGQRNTRLAFDVGSWSSLKNPTEAEQRQIIVAEKLIEFLR